MSWNSAFHQDQVLFRENFQDTKVFHFDLVAAIAASHPHAFENFGREGRSADGTRSASAVVLTVGLVVHTAKTMTFDNALETFAFGYPDGIDHVAFGKDFGNVNGFTLFFLDTEVAEFDDFSLRRSACFLEMPQERLGCIFFFGFGKTKLDGRIAIFAILCFHLGYHTRACFHDGASHVFTCTVIDAGHTDFFTN